MFLLPRFFYDDAAGDNAGGSTEGGATAAEQKPVNTNVDVLKPLFSPEELKDFGFDTPDQLKEHLRQTKANRVPDDVKKRNAEIEEADFLKVSTEEGLINVDEYTAYQGITKKSDRDLVYEKFATEFKADNPEATDELVKTEFESEYRLDSNNAKTKSRGEARMKREAEEARGPLTGKYTAAKKFVDDFRMTKKEEPAFVQFVDNLVTELTPETYTIAKAKDGEDELEIPVKFTKEQREEIAKIFKNPKNFAAFVDNKDKLKEVLTPGLTKKIQGIIKMNNFDNAIAFAFKGGKEVALAKGSTVGAEQPYGVVRTMQPKVNISKTDQELLDESDKRMRQNAQK